MKKTYIFLGLSVLAFALYSKYKVFWDKVSFSVKKVKLKTQLPYTEFKIIITIGANNPTDTSVTLNSAFGELYLQGKKIANISGGSVIMKKGENLFDVVATISHQDILNVSSTKFDTTNITKFTNQLISEPFTTNMTYDTSLGKFTSKDNWIIKEYI
jgi:LEA14-like dessication related protein